MRLTRILTNFKSLKSLVLGVLGALLLTTQAPAQQYRPVRIMPLGDSLTSSIDGQQSYRYRLYRGLVNWHFWVDFVGTQNGVGSGPGPGGFDADHEGHPGATSADILANIRSWAARTQPDIVLMLIGATDLEQGVNPNVALQNTIHIIMQLRSINPNVKVLWALLPPAPDQPNARNYDLAILRLAPLVSTPYSPVRVVNLYTGFDPGSDTVDGVHPNASGEYKFAYRFFMALFPLLLQFRGM